MGNTCSLDESNIEGHVNEKIVILANDFVHSNCDFKDGFHTPTMVVLQQFQKYLRNNLDPKEYDIFLSYTTPNSRLLYLVNAIGNSAYLSPDHKEFIGLSLLFQSETVTDFARFLG